MLAKVEQRGDFYFFNTASITTELPVGYPAPTPPGAIDLKRYPSVRRAQVSGKTGADAGTNVGFFPLFNHISRRQIAMTSPVEVDFHQMPAPGGVPAGAEVAGAEGAGAEGAGAEGADAAPAGGSGASPKWTMSFLYRRAEQGAVGKDERDARVSVVDTEPMTVLSIGFQGNYSSARVERELKAIEAWMIANPGWQVAGEPRALYYNGPDVRPANRWGEAQVPVRRRPAL